MVTEQAGDRRRTSHAESGRVLSFKHISGALAVGVLALATAGVVLYLLTRGPETPRADIARTAVFAVAAVGAVPAAYIAFRRQQITELERADDRADADRAREKEFQDRFVQAAEQLGSLQAATRMAGVHAMAHLADDWGQAGDQPAQQMCVDILCAYLRIPHAEALKANMGNDSVGEGSLAYVQEREVRRTLIRLIRDHLRPDKTPPERRWSDLSFSFEGAHLDCGDFTRSRFTGRFVTFHGVTFAADSTIYFDDVVFAGEQAYFTNAVFARGVTSFRDVSVEAGKLTFEGARTTDGVVDRSGFTSSDDSVVVWGSLGEPGADAAGRTSTSTD